MQILQANRSRTCSSSEEPLGSTKILISAAKKLQRTLQLISFSYRTINDVDGSSYDRIALHACRAFFMGQTDLPGLYR
jgi:hypothetical protein